MPDERLDRTSYLGLLALMVAAADSQNWSYPYWNVKQIDAALAALADAPRDGTVLLANPAAAPTAALSATPGSIAGGITLEIGQTFVDAYGRETAVSPLATVITPAAIADPTTAATLGTPTLGGASGYEGGLLEVWYSWTDGAGGETLASPPAQVDVPYQAGGLLSTVDVTLPSTPAAAGAAGANIYARHRGGNVVLAYRILVDDVTQITLTGAVADCYRSAPLVNSTGSVNAIDITGVAAPAEAVRTRFYIRNAGDSWAVSDQRLKLAGVDEWDPATITYPLLYTGASAELTAGFPPITSQVKAIRPIDLATEAYGTMGAALLPPEAVLEAELVKSIGEGVISGLAVTATSPATMSVTVAPGEALMAAGRFTPAGATRTIPTADATNPRIDLICLADDGTIEGPTENASLKGTPAAAPVAPATPAGYLKLAEVLVDAGATSIAAGKITDGRVLMTTLVAETAARILADAGIASDLSDHEADTTAHSSNAGTIATVNTSCAGSTTQDFTISNVPSCLITELVLNATSEGAVDYDFYLFSDSDRTVLEYQAGNGTGEGIQALTFRDRVPWEWFGGTTAYGRITNHSTDALTNVAVDLKYRK